MSSSDRNHVAVIGSGLGGLAAACTLAARGHRVSVFEKNAWVGGKAAVYEDRGFRFDMGPTILTVPRVLHRVFEEAGRKLEDYLELVRLDPQWRCMFEDGGVLDLEENVDAMTRRLAEFAGSRSAEGYADFVQLSEELHEISERFFFWKSVEDLRDTFEMGSSFNPSTLRDVMKIRMGRSVAGTIRKHVPEKRTAQMLDHFTQYVGSSPYNAPAVLCSIAHMQLDGGVWYPIGGTRAVPLAMEKLARELGVEFHTDCLVERLQLQQNRVTGLQLAGGETIHCGAVVSNMDAIRTYGELVGGEAARNFATRRDYKPACSGVVLYLGLNKAYDHLLHHNFVFSEDPEVEFEQIYNQGEPASDPTAYVCAPSKSEPGVAPAGGEALYILVHTPSLRPHHDWHTMLPDYRQTILNKLKTTGGMPDIEQRIVVEHALTPRDIHERYRVLDGAIYGVASHGKFMGAFKPGNRSREVDGLYLAGGAAHPGPGMPMVMMSGWTAADTLDGDGVVQPAAPAAGTEVASRLDASAGIAG